MNTKPKVYFSCFKYGYEVEDDMDDDVMSRLMGVNHFRELYRLKEKVLDTSASVQIDVPKEM